MLSNVMKPSSSVTTSLWWSVSLYISGLATGCLPTVPAGPKYFLAGPGPATAQLRSESFSAGLARPDNTGEGRDKMGENL